MESDIPTWKTSERGGRVLCIDVHRYDLVELFGTQSTFRTGHVTTTFYDVTNIWSEIENFNFEDILLSYYD